MLITLHSLVALTVFLLYVFGSLLNVLCLLSVILFSKKAASLLIIASLCVGDLFTSLPLAFGCVEAGWLSDYVHPLSPYVTGALTNFSFCICSLTLALMAVNRFVRLNLAPQHYERWFGRRATCVYLAACWTTALCYSIVAHTWLCCPVVWNRRYMVSLYSQPPNTSASGAPPVNAMADVDHALTVSVIAVTTVCYAVVACRLAVWKLAHAGAHSSAVHLSVCWQFVLVLLAYYVLNTVWYFVGDLAAHFAEPRLHYTVSYALAVNFTCNPYIYLTFNAEIMSGVRQMVQSVRCSMAVVPSKFFQVAPAHNNHHLHQHGDLPNPQPRQAGASGNASLQLEDIVEVSM